jgi:hypothetical protein
VVDDRRRPPELVRDRRVEQVTERRLRLARVELAGRVDDDEPRALHRRQPALEVIRVAPEPGDPAA